MYIMPHFFCVFNRFISASRTYWLPAVYNNPKHNIIIPIGISKLIHPFLNNYISGSVSEVFLLAGHLIKMKSFY